jgi:hypothetical protein
MVFFKKLCTMWYDCNELSFATCVMWCGYVFGCFLYNCVLHLGRNYNYKVIILLHLVVLVILSLLV